ncbi:hypothetical protein SCP_0304000 [Sparassis crispa]|uniref:GRF-type domain-containing protein n=1 Tax=Sparassis crispa TaxID=139825 RepID=A0A401GEW6_9APHY|nr:hypothetical protein SCP_0304000 [Sparassis crispa]GBE80681.1 hypothetical protein SCP_0304000 [Sparassis crispa]
MAKSKTNPRDSEGVVRCPGHHEPAQRLVSKTDRTRGRAFYKCAKPVNSEQCDFFYWEDDLPPAQPQAAAPGSSQESPRPSQRQRAIMARTPSAPSSPTKRPRSATPPATPTRQGPSYGSQALLSGSQMTPSSKFTPSQKERRLMDINAGLSARKSMESLRSVPPSPSKRSRIESSEGGHSYSPTEGDVGGQEESVDEDAVWLSHQSQGEDGARPSTPPPYHFRGTHPEIRGPRTPGSSSAHGRSENDMLLTPPQSSQLAYASSSQLSYADAPDSPTKDKGKGKALDGSNLLCDKIQADPEYPFYERAAALQGSTQTGGSVTLDQLSADVINSRIAGLSNIPDYVRKLEGKLAAAQQSVLAKEHRIEELERELKQEKLSIQNQKNTYMEIISTMQARRE